MWKITLLVFCLINFTDVLVAEPEKQAQQSKEQINAILLINYLTIDSYSSDEGRNPILDKIEKVRQKNNVVAEFVFGALEAGVDSETGEPFIAKTSKGPATVLKQSIRLMEESSEVHTVVIFDPSMNGSADEYEEIKSLHKRITNFYSH